MSIIQSFGVTNLQPLKIQNPMNVAYEEMIRRADSFERINLTKKLDTLSAKEHCIHTLISVLAEGKWDDEIFKNIDYPYYALEALKRGVIDPCELATIQIFWEIQQKHTKFETIALFNSDGTVNEKARAMIKSTFYLTGEYHDTQQEPILKDADIDQLFDKMRLLPKSEQFIWEVEDYDCPGNKPLAHPNISQFLYTRGGFNIFMWQNHSRIVASFGLRQVFLDVRFGDNAIKMKPVLGYSSLEDIRQNGLENERDFAIHHPAIALPCYADKRWAPGYNWGDHEFYHANVASCVSSSMRRLIIKVADFVQIVLNTEPLITENEKKFCTLFRELMIDLDLDQFRPELYKGRSLNDRFWAHLSTKTNAIAQVDGIYLTSNLREKLFNKLALQLREQAELAAGPRVIHEKSVQTARNVRIELEKERFPRKFDDQPYILLQIIENYPLKSMIQYWET